MLTLDSFLAEIDDFLKRARMSPTAFGKAAVGDPNLVHDLRSGRMPGLRLIGEVQAFIATNDPAKPSPSHHPIEDTVSS